MIKYSLPQRGEASLVALTLIVLGILGLAFYMDFKPSITGYAHIAPGVQHNRTLVWIGGNSSDDLMQRTVLNLLTNQTILQENLTAPNGTAGTLNITTPDYIDIATNGSIVVVVGINTSSDFPGFLQVFDFSTFPATILKEITDPLFTFTGVAINRNATIIAATDSLSLNVTVYNASFDKNCSRAPTEDININSEKPVVAGDSVYVVMRSKNTASLKHNITRVNATNCTAIESADIEAYINGNIDSLSMVETNNTFFLIAASDDTIAPNTIGGIVVLNSTLDVLSSNSTKMTQAIGGGPSVWSRNLTGGQIELWNVSGNGTIKHLGNISIGPKFLSTATEDAVYAMVFNIDFDGVDFTTNDSMVVVEKGSVFNCQEQSIGATQLVSAATGGMVGLRGATVVGSVERICVAAPFCGDGATNAELGETCDDEDTSTPASCGVGACQTNIADACINSGDPSECTTVACLPGTPGTEVCNGIDDDCDGATDEGLGTTTCGVGACEVTVNNCVGGVTQTCNPGSPSAEACNGIDDDCNGAIDEGGVCAPPPGCGNSIIDGGEDCDPATPDAVSAQCPADPPGRTCLANCDCGVDCGNGVPETGEACDDGVLLNSDTTPDACRTTCVSAFCGDSVTDTGEDCDDGDGSDNNACKTDCTENTCGDSVIETGVEGCDDGIGNSNAPDADCRTDCTPQSCGDNIADTGEVCGEPGLAACGQGQQCNSCACVQTGGGGGGGGGGTEETLACPGCSIGDRRCGNAIPTLQRTTVPDFTTVSLFECRQVSGGCPRWVTVEMQAAQCQPQFATEEREEKPPEEEEEEVEDIVDLIDEIPPEEPCTAELVLRLRQEGAQLEAQAQQINARGEEIQRLIPELDAEITNTQNALQQETENIERLSQEIEARTNQLNDITNQIQQIRDRVQELQQLIAGGANGNVRGPDPLAGVSGPGAGVSFDGGETFVTVEGNEGVENLIETMRRNAEIMRELQALSTQLRGLKQQKQQLENERTDLKQQLEQAQQHAQQLDQDLTEKEQKRESLAQEATQLDQQAQELNALIDRFNQANNRCVGAANRARDNLVLALSQLERMPPEERARARERYTASGVGDDPTDSGEAADEALDTLIGIMIQESQCPPPQIKTIEGEVVGTGVALRGVSKVWISAVRNIRGGGLSEEEQRELLEGMTDTFQAVDTVTSLFGLTTEGPGIEQTASAAAQLAGTEIPPLSYDSFIGKARDAITDTLRKWLEGHTLGGLPDEIDVSFSDFWQVPILAVRTEKYECINHIMQLVSIEDVPRLGQCQSAADPLPQNPMKWGVDYSPSRASGLPKITELQGSQAWQDAFRQAVVGATKHLGDFGLIIGRCPEQ